MFSKFIGCCFPSKNDHIVKVREFQTDNDDNDPTKKPHDIIKQAKLGNNFTMIEENGLMEEKKSSNNIARMSEDQTSQKRLYNHSPIRKVENDDNQRNNRTVILDRMKLYNETQDHELFKSRISNIIQAKTMKTAYDDNTKLESVRLYI
jgi:hypothetical protein